jgi:predicted transcriptional regulator
MRILEVLKNGSMNQKDLKEQLDVSYATLGMALKRLAKQKKVYKIGKEWGLATQEGF